jgi:uncharacterized protein YecE (DUF72 family)
VTSAGRIVVGTSGWSPPGSGAPWYPAGLAPRERLAWYAARFDGVEVDSTFYALPARRTVERWEQITPPGFTLDVKLHRLLSRHAAPPSSLPAELREGVKLSDTGRVVLDDRLERELCERTFEVVRPLRDAGKLSSFLLQLTPAFKPGDHRLGELEPLLDRLAPVPVAIELRHRGWLREPDETFAWFRSAGAAFVGVDAPELKAPVVLPAVDAVTRDDLAYLRAHGRNAEGYLRGRSAAERFDWPYSDEELGEIAQRTERLARCAATVRLMFGNGPHAMASAVRMREVLDRRQAEVGAPGGRRPKNSR